jgi:voltage-gated potassium channel
MNQYQRTLSALRDRLHEIVFEADTPEGKGFDIALLILIVISVLTVMLESIASLQDRYAGLFLAIEWAVTILFTLEYLLRLWIVHRPRRYAISFFGIIDLLSILPAYISLLLPVSHYLVIIRVLRLLRIFRVFKLAKYVRDSNTILIALRNSRYKITVFLMSIFLLVLVLGSMMYVVEGHVNEGFDSIPRAIYWAIITLTTVGYGDITPVTPLGQMIASLVMIMGYSIIAVPTGIVSAEMTRSHRHDFSTQACPFCMVEGHVPEAVFCHQCGSPLNPERHHPA